MTFNHILRVSLFVLSVSLVFGFKGPIISSRLARLYLGGGKTREGRLSSSQLNMALDTFLTQKLDSIKRSFDALTERLDDPDVGNDRKLMLQLSRERSSIEETVTAYDEWTSLEKERLGLKEMEIASDTDADLKEMVRAEQTEIEAKQDALESSITLMLLPRDPNDDRNVMLEVRAGTGGDEASIFAGDLVNAYRKYAESNSWRISPVSET